jgi:hypothetical protein
MLRGERGQLSPTLHKEEAGSFGKKGRLLFGATADGAGRTPPHEQPVLRRVRGPLAPPTLVSDPPTKVSPLEGNDPGAQMTTDCPCKRQPISPGWLDRLVAEVGAADSADAARSLVRTAVRKIAKLPHREQELVCEVLHDAIRQHDT